MDTHGEVDLTLNYAQGESTDLHRIVVQIPASVSLEKSRRGGDDDVCSCQCALLKRRRAGRARRTGEVQEPYMHSVVHGTRALPEVMIRIVLPHPESGDWEESH